MSADRTFSTPDGNGDTGLTLPGCSLLFVRNARDLMTNGAIVDANYPIVVYCCEEDCLFVYDAVRRNGDARMAPRRTIRGRR